MQRQNTSPLIPSIVLAPDNLVTNRHLQAVIEQAIEEGLVDDSAAEEWREQKKHLASALDLYRDGQIHEAAAKGLPIAQGELARKAFESRDYPTAMHWATLASDVGESTGTFLLGYAYYSGRGKPIDWRAAVDCFIKVQDKVHCAKYVIRMYKLCGNGIEKNDRLLYEWAKRGRHECPANAFQLGLCYYEGVGTEVNYFEALEAWRRCDYPEAMYRRGKMLIKGTGCSIDRIEGVKHVEEAAKQGFTDAIHYLNAISNI
jgi:TPR repeat protein